MVPQLLHTEITLDGDDAVGIDLDHLRRDRVRLLPRLVVRLRTPSQLHLDPVRVVAGEMQSAAIGPVLRHSPPSTWRSHLAEASCGTVLGPCPSTALDGKPILLLCHNLLPDAMGRRASAVNQLQGALRVRLVVQQRAAVGECVPQSLEALTPGGHLVATGEAEPFT